MFEKDFEQQTRQRKVAQMICAELHLECVCRLATRYRHDPCVVDENVQPRVVGQECRCEFPDRFEICQIEACQRDIGVRRGVAYPFDSLLAPGLIPASRDECGTASCQSDRGLESESAVRTRYDRRQP
jgi:hypothetical protein